MSNKHESMIGIMKLYDLRREAVLREAREWFDGFYAESFQDIVDVFESEEDRYFRMVLTYWDMAAAFVNHGAIDEQLFNEATVEHIVVYSKIEPFIKEFRELTGSPQLLANLEKLVTGIPDAGKMTAEFRERTKSKIAGRQKAAAV